MGKTDALHILHTLYIIDHLTVVTTKFKTFTIVALKTARKILLSKCKH
jgi:hypothetical protein